MKYSHERIESIAGAIALGEATDRQRQEYRLHIAQCAACLHAYGGEREIERVSATVANARDEEVWEPALGNVVQNGLARRARYARSTLSIAAACLVVTFGVRLAILNGALHFMTPASAAVAYNTDGMRISLEPRHEVSATSAPVHPAQPHLTVVHNVVQIARAPVAAPPALSASKRPAPAQQIVTITVHPALAPKQTAYAQASNVPIWRRNDSWQTVARTTTTSLTETAPQSFAQNAESIRMMHPQVMRDAAPVGGETAINPQPPMSAYYEGAGGTTVFEVLIDEQGNPTKCTITSTSGYGVLDDSVCKAAMLAKYSPKTIDGRAVAGIYHDAFTFRLTTDPDH